MKDKRMHTDEHGNLFLYKPLVAIPGLRLNVQPIHEH